MIIIENEDTFRSALQLGINLFLGAGFSTLAKDKDGKRLPLGRELAEEMIKEFDVPQFTGFALAQIATTLESTQLGNFRDFLQQRFTVFEYDAKYKNLWKIKINSIFTTNIDNLLPKVFEDNPSAYLNDLDINGPAFKDKSAINYYALHGSINVQSSHLRFGSTDLAAAFSADPDRWSALTQSIQKAPTLFWGYGMADPGVLQALSSESVRGRSVDEKWVVLHPTENLQGTKEYFAALGFQVIVSDVAELLQYISLVKPISNLVNEISDNTQLDNLFSFEQIPSPDSVPVRPVLDFYLGAPPQWSDIFFGQLHRTQHYLTAKNTINSDSHTILFGVPASGKTTLLMQLAADVPFVGAKLYFQSLVPERASLLVKALAGNSAIVFIDNFTDSLEAVENLSRIKNIKIVAADRDYNFEFISHRINRRDFKIHNVSELSATDIQSCISHIPESLKRISPSNRDYGNSDLNKSNSLFEIIEANVSSPTLRSRYASVMQQLNETDPVLADLLLMLSYVHRCRVPSSMDMILAYLSYTTNNYKDAYDMLEKLGKQVSEYFGSLTEDDQDYYRTRSAIVGEAVLYGADAQSLRAMFNRFHKRISRYRICRYDVFKRYAYDHRLIATGFTDWQEGKAFYDEVIRSVDIGTAYLYQQAALYLNRKKRYTEAFQMIDRAITESGRRIWTINNSQAVILFQANISYASNSNAVHELHRSMQILTDCYKADRRKPYHAITYAEQALQYAEIMSDTYVREYLDTSLQWLIDVQRTESSNRKIAHLISKIKQVINKTSCK